VLEDNAYNTVVSLDTADPPPPLVAYAPATAEVLSVGSLAKVVWGGLRVGWVRAPARSPTAWPATRPAPTWAARCWTRPWPPGCCPGWASCRPPGRDHPPALDHLAALLTAQLPGWRWRSPDGGSALWVELPGTDAAVFAQVALRHGVDVVPGAVMDPSGAHDSYLRLPFTFPVDILTELVERLRRAWTELQRHGPATPTPLHPIV
jgi:DNA-binding transcriptional MocR family regulator